LYELAQWYPRLAVYDDVRGWKTEQYLGQGEFYLEYGDFDVALTVPASFVVAATGTLLNPAEVLTPTQRARLATALKSDTTVPIIAKSEVGQSFTRPRSPGASPTLPWRFSAKNVRDVAWAAAPNFIWDASGWQGVLLQSFYPPQADADRDRGNAPRWLQFARSGRDEPPMLFADRVDPTLLGHIEYTKPATGLYLLRHYVLADTTRFDAAFREYIRRWAFRHHTPADFFRTMEDALGEDLSWFWRGWFYRTDVIDQAVDSVRTRSDSGGTTALVYLASPGGLPMPVDLRLTLASGAVE